MEDGAGGEALAQAAWEVYGVTPAEFVAARTRWVKELRSRGLREEARSVAALRKPSVSAAAVNAVVRAQDPVADRLREVGARLRHAQSALDVAGLTSLRGVRDEVLKSWVEAARRHAQGRLTAAVETEVRDIGVAALADASATEVALSGTLTRALSYGGLGEVDVSDAVARTSTGVVLTRIEGGAGAVGEDEADGGTEDEADGGDDETEAEPPPRPAPAPVAERGAGPDLSGLREELDLAEDAVVDARTGRRTAAAAEREAAGRVGVAEEGLAQARRLLRQAEAHLAAAREEHERATAALGEADAALTAARGLRDRARAVWEEAQDDAEPSDT